MIGEVLGKYRVIEKLGHGGMAEVFRAEHVLLGGQVAIKVLHRSVSRQPTIIERLFNEARITATLGHPGIVKTFDFGQHSNERSYLVMEYLDGESLRERLRRERRLSLTRSLDYARQLCSALSAAHQAGVIHRDLTPANIYLVRDADIPGGERARILDFGIAKQVVSSRTSTRQGVILGTPHYMSPEQCRSSSNVDHRSDLYALGCILFRALVGQPPFRGKNKHEVISAHIGALPQSPRELVPGIPIEVDQLILRLLAKDPADRFDSAEQVLQVLSEIAFNIDCGARAATNGFEAMLVGSRARAKTQTALSWSSETRTPMAVATVPHWKPAVIIGAIGLSLVIGGLLGSTSDPTDPALTAPAAASGAALIQSAEPASQAPSDSPPQPEAGPGKPDGEPAQSPDSEPLARIVIDSTPPGADVYQMPEGVRIGTTPLTLERAPITGELVLFLKLPGYRDASLVADASRSGAYKADLARAGNIVRAAKSRRAKNRKKR